LLPSKYGAALRSSPIVCGLDTVTTFTVWIYLIIVSRSPLRAARLWAEFRVRDIDVSRDTESGFERLQKNAPVRLFLFLIGALPQIIKLYSLEGPSWTEQLHGMPGPGMLKILGAMYLAVFFTTEMLAFLASFDQSTGEPSRLERVVEIYYQQAVDVTGPIALFQSLRFAFYLYALGFIAATKPYVDQLWWWHFPRIYIYVMVGMIAIYIKSRLQFSFTVRTLCFGIFTSLSSGMPRIPLTKDEVAENFPRIAKGKIWDTTAAAVSVHFALGLAFITVKAILQNFHGGRWRLPGLGPYWFFAIFHFATLVLYFGFEYESTGIYKSAFWTDRCDLFGLWGFIQFMILMLVIYIRRRI
jgi:hypothetical protein